jgi:hypothetical protein
MISVSIPRAAVSSASGILPHLAIAAALTGFADWLFYMRVPGISVALFAVALCAATLVANPVRASRSELTVAAAVLAAALVPALEDWNVLSFAFAVAGTCIFALMVTGWPARPMLERLGDIGWLIGSGPFRLASDLAAAVRAASEREGARHGANWLLAWLVPVGLGGVFLLLFLQANPLIESWFNRVDTSSWQAPDLARVLFWLAVVVVIWPFLRIQLADRPTAQDVAAVLDLLPPAPAPAASPEQPVASTPGPLFGKIAILRSLVLFNALFAVQSALDVAYLWGGLALPSGMSYASYAHRGAYPLIVTALLAGAFVLAAMRPGAAVARSRPIRALVFLWIGQNVLLVLSSMLRLDLYVDAYSLTGWRCAAFVWMLLVAIGLVLIVARIALDRSNSWLLWGNAAALAATLYVCSLVDFPGLIARFNVEHSREIAGTGASIDLAYLCSLGPAALPALDTLVAKAGGRLGQPNVDCRASLEMTHRMRLGGWRSFTFRGYRLLRYLDERDARAFATGIVPPAEVSALGIASMPQ